MDLDCGSARDRLGKALGKYYLREILGAGGTAVVYRATGPDGETVAVKVLHDHLSRSDEICRRFVREGELGAVLDHPGTIRVFDQGETEGGAPYLVLEYLEGESLEQMRVRAGGRLEMWEVLDMCDQLLAVLEIAHAKNVIHRDIKPSNLFLTKASVLKVLDFGIARVTDDTSASATKTGQTVGTPAFMAPEQALSRPRDVDGRTDLWSVGATLFTLLSGDYVHIAENSSEHLVKAATMPARSIAKVLPGVPANVEALIARCLAFDKNARWTSATAMREQLSYVRKNPGRRVGTTTSPPPDLVASESTLERPSTADISVMDMPIASRSGDDLVRRRWLLPFAIMSTVGLVVMSALVLVLAIRATTLSRAASASRIEPSRVVEPPPAAVTLPPPAVVAAPDPPASAVVIARPSPSSSAKATTASPASSSVRPRGPASPRRDVYRPF